MFVDLEISQDDVFLSPHLISIFNIILESVPLPPSSNLTFSHSSSTRPRHSSLHYLRGCTVADMAFHGPNSYVVRPVGALAITAYVESVERFVDW